MPSGRYLNAFADYLNNLLPFSDNFEKFKQEIGVFQVHSTDEVIQESHKAMNLYKLKHFVAFLFQIMNENDSIIKDSLYKVIHPKTKENLFFPHD